MDMALAHVTVGPKGLKENINRSTIINELAVICKTLSLEDKYTAITGF
jgi:hypothetical protein